MSTLPLPYNDHAALFKDIQSIIDQARTEIATSVNSTLVLANWHIGNRINQEILKNERAEYGEQIIRKISKDLTEEYGRGYSPTNLFIVI